MCECREIPLLVADFWCLVEYISLRIQSVGTAITHYASVIPQKIHGEVICINQTTLQTIFAVKISLGMIGLNFFFDH